MAGPPLMRRRYLDMMISQVDRGYLPAMQKYAKVLQQRNSLLKRIQNREAESTNSLLGPGTGARRRADLLGASDALGHVVPQAMMQMERLSDGLEQLQLTYRPSLGGLDERDAPIDDSNGRRAC
ncbi:MAG: hypothetical protein IPG14_14175 [Dehalococcoidia bacterium]|nr:hypothetical protein [Dehalococcoidia bacterium]